MHRTLPPGALLALACVLMTSSAGHAQEPSGPKFRVNTYTTAHQYRQAVAAAPNGDFVVVWSSDHLYGAFRDVFGQLYDARGRARGTEFRISETFSADDFPDAAADANGDFVVVWWSPSEFQVRARRFAADGTPVSAEATIGSGNYPSVARTPNGSYVVVWLGIGSVVGRRFDLAGNPLGAEFDTGIPSTRESDVAVAPSGDFVVVAEVGLTSNVDVVGRCFDATGTPKGPQFAVNAYVTSAQGRPRVAMDATGGFVVVWSSFGQDGSYSGIVARSFDSNCNPSGPDEVVNTRTFGDQSWPDVAVDGTGAFLVTWADFKLPTRVDAMGRRISSSGGLRGSEFEVRAYDPAQAPGGFYPRAAGAANGTFNVVWWEEQPPAGRDVHARRLRPLGARSLDVDGASGTTSDGNRVFEPNETVRVVPSWFNSVEQPLSATGQVMSFTGPTGPGIGYVFADPIADHGTIAPGATGSCATTGDCYGLGLTLSGTRPVTHWDARLVEDLEPYTLGEAREWTLHIGDSFQDVPRANPFYRYVETLLHSGVTSGCTAAEFCPGGPTTREQMAVFVLKAKEGPGYEPPACTLGAYFDVPASSPFCPYIRELSERGVVSGCRQFYYCPTDPVSREQAAVFLLRTLDPALTPPACTVPVFADVPASSPFCRWIEELARRGITSGCGGGNYCPADPVTREQMAVFLTTTFGLILYGP